MAFERIRQLLQDLSEGKTSTALGGPACLNLKFVHTQFCQVFFLFSECMESYLIGNVTTVPSIEPKN